MDYQRVPDDERNRPTDPQMRQSKYDQLVADLRAGATLFQPGGDRKLERIASNLRSTLSNRGIRIATRRRTIDGQRGVVFWLTSDDGR